MQYRAIYPSIDPKKNKFHIFSIFFFFHSFDRRKRRIAVSITRASRAIPNNFPSETDRNPFTHPIFASFLNLAQSFKTSSNRPSSVPRLETKPTSTPSRARTGEISRVSTLFTPRIQPNPIDRRPKNQSLYLLRIEEAYLKKSLSIQLSSFSLSTIGQLELTRYNFQCPARYILDFTFTNNMRQPPACTHRERERERGEFPRLDNPGHTHA